MKFISYTYCGEPGYGAVVGDGIVALGDRLAPGVTTLRAAIDADLLEVAADFCRDRVPDYNWSDVSLLPVVPDPAKILCIGLNYEDHKKETKNPTQEYPTVFMRYADSQVAHRQPMIKPDSSEMFDYEAEMAVIIGRGGRNIPESSAMDHVAGYACYNEGSVRNYQRHTTQFGPGKNFPGTGAFGPYMVTPDEVGDYTKLPISCRLNGEVMQESTLANLIFPLPVLIAYCSQFTPLSPGDVIVSGTPGGVGSRREPPVYLQPGDWVEVDIGVVGTLANPVMTEMH